MTAYRWNDPARTLPRRRLADRIRAEVGPEDDSWGEADDPIYNRGRELKPCGTWAAYLRHLNHDEAPCRPCREACREACRERSGARKTDVRKSADVIADRLEVLAGMRFHDTREPVPLPGFTTVGQAAEQLGVTRRTIERYKKLLQEQGAMAS